jgi:hypothetical protein
MNPIKLGLLALASIAITACAQEYVEASGQTVVFNLAAGAKAAWNPQGSPVIHQAFPPQLSAISSMKIQSIGTSTKFIITKNAAMGAQLKLFDIRGQLKDEFILDKSSEQITLPKRYSAGRYLARLTSGASTIVTQSFTVVR